MLTADQISIKPEGEPWFDTDLETFLRDNKDDADLCARVRALAPGETISVGGGALSPCLIRRGR